jgi:hypothetical protein
MTVKIVRFKDGLDVISNVFYKHDMGDQPNGEVELTNPMMFELRNQNLVMEHWLPLAIMKEKSVVIKNSEILCTMEPNEDFEEYYTNAVKQMNKALKESKEKDKEDIQDMLEALAELEDNKGIKIH